MRHGHFGPAPHVFGVPPITHWLQVVPPIAPAHVVSLTLSQLVPDAIRGWQVPFGAVPLHQKPARQFVSSLHLFLHEVPFWHAKSPGQAAEVPAMQAVPPPLHLFGVSMPAAQTTVAVQSTQALVHAVSRLHARHCVSFIAAQRVPAMHCAVVSLPGGVAGGFEHGAPPLHVQAA